MTVKDTGIGISEAHLKMIFDEFRQASEGQNRSFEGTGLGLTISRKMIQLLGGEISVESTIGAGSVFTISVPYPEIHYSKKRPDTFAKQDIKKPVIKDHGISKIDLLLVEDNDVNSHLIFAFLKDKFNVDWAVDGDAAIEMVRQKKYGIILMDINLGHGMDGLQATKTIRQIKGCESVPIIALTGYTMFGDRERLIEGGCTGYIAKPFTKSEILEILDKILSQ